MKMPEPAIKRKSVVSINTTWEYPRWAFALRCMLIYSAPRWMMIDNRAYLVLWKTTEAELCLGITPSGSVGSHMKGLVRGDRLFVTACDGSEVYLLGAMQVTGLGAAQAGPYRGKPSARGKTLSGAFQMVPLGSIKWRLRFEGTDFPKLSRDKSLLWQVRSRRRLAPQSADLLLKTLASQRRVQDKLDQRFAREGRLVMQAGTRRERDPKVRRDAFKVYGFTCMICGLKPLDVYGPFAKKCLEVHHLKPLGVGGKKRSATTLRDVILVCPTCHRALHLSGVPAAWRRFRSECTFG